MMAGGAAGALRGMRPRRDAQDSDGDGDGGAGGGGRRRGGRVWEPPPARLVSKDLTKYAEVMPRVRARVVCVWGGGAGGGGVLVSLCRSWCRSRLGHALD